MKFAVSGLPGWRAVLASLFVIALPVLAALALADRQSRQDMHKQAMQLAEEVLLRSHRLSSEIGDIRRAFSASQQPPCSPAQMRLMVSLTIEHPLLTALGYVVDDKLICSSFGLHGSGIPLGPPDYLSRHQSQIRTQVAIPQLSHEKLLVATALDSGFTTIIHPSVALDIHLTDADINVGVYNARTLKTLSQRGIFRSAWNDRLGPANETSFFDGEFFVAIKRSPRFDYVAYAALPRNRLDNGRMSLALVLVPLGMIAGVLLAIIIMQAIRRHTSLSTQLRVAIKRNELHLVYQPVVDLRTGRWVGAEALLRWQRADGQYTPPDVFIPVAEYARLITQITRRVCELAVHDLRPLLLEHPHFRVSLNFSAEDFATPHTLDTLCTLLDRAELNPAQFQIEATERVVMEKSAVQSQIRALHQAGLHLAIDDFGTGYSSLAYLASLDVDTLKIDKLFVESIGTQAATSQVVAHIIEMVKSLKLVMIAEGVETEQQARYLREHGVQYAQGWYYARPMSAQALAEGLLAQAQNPQATAARASDQVALF